MSDGPVHGTIKMDTQDTTTATLLKYFIDAMAVSE